jgi:uncharacterized iron-regulated membrane protein
MKLKGLNNRAYSVLFHTHTVAGIVISFALFVIFYAGAFSLFRAEIYQWENPAARIEVPSEINYTKVIDVVDSIYKLDWMQTTNIVLPSEESPFIKVYGAFREKSETDSTDQIVRVGVAVSPIDYSVYDLKNPNTTLSETIYYLHYFRQIPVVGLYLSGLVGLFFLFASLTGILIHWKNIFTKFFAFTTKGKWKSIWTNAHTVLGVIGLPFQIIYAVTGAFFGLLSLILLPAVFLIYDGDTSKVFEKINPEELITLKENPKTQNHISFEEALNIARQTYPDHQIFRAVIRNYGHEDALITWRIKSENDVRGEGTAVMYLSDGKILDEFSVHPSQKTYTNSIINLITQLHFGSFGGYLVKAIYFILSMLTCFIIISGVMIWKTARDKKSYTFKQRLFHHRVTKVYLAICLTMFPAFALFFIVNKILPIEMNHRALWSNTVFFSSWLLFIIISVRQNSYGKMNRNLLCVGGIVCLFIPLANGWITGDWFWTSTQNLPIVAGVDIFWLICGLSALWFVLYTRKKKFTTDAPAPSL